MEERLHHAYNRAQEFIERESGRQKQYYDKNYRCSELKAGDLVLVRVKAFGTDHKIADKWEDDIYRVVFQVRNTPAYQVQNTKNMQCRVVHRNYIFPLRLRKINPEKTCNKICRTMLVRCPQIRSLSKFKGGRKVCRVRYIFPLTCTPGFDVGRTQ